MQGNAKFDVSESGTAMTTVPDSQPSALVAEPPVNPNSDFVEGKLPTQPLQNNHILMIEHLLSKLSSRTMHSRPESKERTMLPQ